MQIEKSITRIFVIKVTFLEIETLDHWKNDCKSDDLEMFHLLLGKLFR